MFGAAPKGSSQDSLGANVVSRNDDDDGDDDGDDDDNDDDDGDDEGDDDDNNKSVHASCQKLYNRCVLIAKSRYTVYG